MKIQTEINKEKAFCIKEFNKEPRNSIITNCQNAGLFMNHKKTELTKGGMKVIIQFSEETENRKFIEREVKDILDYALLEQLDNLRRKDEKYV